MSDYRDLQPSKTIHEIELTYKQDRFIFRPYDYGAFIAGWGSGKTEGGICKITKLALETPNGLYLICRKEFTDLKDSTIPDFERYTGYTVGSDKNCKLPNGSVIMFRHAKELDILKNTNLSGFMIEQAEEFETAEQFWYLCGRVRRDGTKEYCRIIIANTNGHNWIWKLWKGAANEDGDTFLNLPHPISGEKKRFTFHLEEGTTFECNPDHLPDAFLANLAVVKEKQPEVYNRFVMNSYDESDIIAYVIPESIIRPCIGLEQPEDNRHLVSIDPAYGGDRCPIFGLEGTKIVEKLILRKDLNEKIICGHLNAMRSKIKADLITGDAIGNGHGIFDELDSQGINNHRIISSQKSTMPEAYFNLRAEMAWEVRKMFENKEINMIDDEELITELSALKYKPNANNIIKLEPKEKTKETLGKSPDLGDTAIMAWYSLRFVEHKKEDQVKKDQAWRNRIKNRRPAGSAMTG